MWKEGGKKMYKSVTFPIISQGNKLQKEATPLSLSLSLSLSRQLPRITFMCFPHNLYIFWSLWSNSSTSSSPIFLLYFTISYKSHSCPVFCVRGFRKRFKYSFLYMQNKKKEVLQFFISISCHQIFYTVLQFAILCYAVFLLCVTLHHTARFQHLSQWWYILVHLPPQCNSTPQRLGH